MLWWFFSRSFDRRATCILQIKDLGQSYSDTCFLFSYFAWVRLGMFIAIKECFKQEELLCLKGATGMGGVGGVI